MHRYKNPDECTHYHQIYYDDLYDQVLSRIRKIAKSVENGSLLESVNKRMAKQKKTDKLEAEKKKISTRMRSNCNIRFSNASRKMVGMGCCC